MSKEFGLASWDDRLDLFAGAEPTGGKNFVCAGMFCNRQDEYLLTLSKLTYSLMKGKNVLQTFKNFLEKKNLKIEGRALYSKSSVNYWRKSYKIYKASKDTGFFYRRSPRDQFKVSALSIGEASDIADRSGLVILRIEGYQDRELNRELEWELRELLLEEWLSLSEDQRVVDYLKQVKEVFDTVKTAIGGKYYDYPFNRLAFYLLPVHFDRFFNAVIVSRASLFYRREETRRDLWEEIEKALKEKRYDEDLKYYLKDTGKDEDLLKKVLEKALQEETLKILLQDWKIFLKKVIGRESKRIKGVFLEREKGDRGGTISYGKYIVPRKNIYLYIYAEKGTQELVEKLKSALSKLPYMQDVKVEFHDRTFFIENLFGGQNFFELLKGIKRDGSEIRHEEAIKLLYALYSFVVNLNKIQAMAEKYSKRGYFAGNLLLLNTDLQENGRYEFWEYVRFIYDYYGLPVQTVTRRTIRQIGESAVKKNLMISLYKDSKILQFDFDGFDIPEHLTLYAFLERPSTKFLYRKDDIDPSGKRHYLYEIYRIDVEGKSATVELEEKFFIMANGAEGDVNAMRDSLKEKLSLKDIKFCFITAVRDSFLNALYQEFAQDPNFKDRAIVARYMELKTAYLSPTAEKDCFVVYTDTFEKVLHELGIRMEEDRAVIAIKPPPPSNPEYADFHHPSLQVFFTEKLGWLKEEVYSRRKNLFFFTVIALSMFESESFDTPFSKLNVWSTRRGADLLLHRENLDYRFNLWSVLFEMLEYVRHIPGEVKEKDGKIE